VTGAADSPHEAGSGGGQDRFVWVEVTSEAGLRDWLARHHDQHDAVWLVTYKKCVPDWYVTREQVLDQLIAHGWCDGIMRRIDDRRVRQLVSPRRTRPWAASYETRAERLIATGTMTPAGLSSVTTAKATGMWDALNDVDALTVPADLTDALAAQPPADDNFAAFPASTRRNILRWIATAKTPPTRATRIARTVADAARNMRVKQRLTTPTRCPALPADLDPGRSQDAERVVPGLGLVGPGDRRSPGSRAVGAVRREH